MHHGTCVTHVPWCMSGSLTRGDGENVPGIPGACAPAILRIWQEAHGGKWCKRTAPTYFHGISINNYTFCKLTWVTLLCILCVFWTIAVKEQNILQFCALLVVSWLLKFKSVRILLCLFFDVWIHVKPTGKESWNMNNPVYANSESKCWINTKLVLQLLNKQMAKISPASRTGVLNDTMVNRKRIGVPFNNRE